MKKVVTGVIHMHPRGFGFVTPSDGTEDIFVPKSQTANAVDSDTVEVSVSPLYSDKGPDGKVVAIVERGRTHIAGTILRPHKKNSYLAYAPLFGDKQEIIVTSDEPLQKGDRVILQVTDWGDPTLCHHSHTLGHISDPSCDVPAAIEEFSLRNDFPKAAVQEAKKLPHKIFPKDFEGRVDLRQLETLTVDPATAKDFDDALSIQKEKGGGFRLWVHIADVSHYVPPGSALDKEARLRANSTYFPGTCVPMLPPALSENLCSLKPNVNRLAATVEMVFDSQGTLTHHSFYRSVIHSDKRFAYEDAYAVIQKKRRSKHAPALQSMVALCHLLKKKRFERGSLEFSIAEMIVIVDESGTPTGTQLVEYDISHQLVEEFMLKANEVIATHLSNKGEPIAYRVHEEPPIENLSEFADTAALFGFTLPTPPEPKDLQALFEEVKDTVVGQFLATHYIRKLRMAVYSAENIGHYGLNLTHYCHFTSPIRRYVDLIVHRTLFEKALPPKQLDAAAAHCSEQERLSARAENSVKLLKKLRLLQKQRHPHKAVITSIKPFGLVFEVVDLMLEGFLHISEVGDDWYEYDPSSQSLLGENKGTTLTVGNPIWVKPTSIDLITSTTRWEITKEKKHA